MNEWYVLTIGGKPFEAILGRRQAVERLIDHGEFPTTPEEKKAISRFLEGIICDLGAGLLVVGKVKAPHEDQEPDRKITRVIGPGTEV